MIYINLCFSNPHQPTSYGHLRPPPLHLKLGRNQGPAVVLVDPSLYIWAALFDSYLAYFF